MKKIILLLLVIFIIVSCGNNSNSKLKREQEIIDEIELADSIQQVKDASLTIIKAYQDSIAEVSLLENDKVAYKQTLKLRKKYIGFKYEYPQSIDFMKNYGPVETLTGTDNNIWVVYFTKGNFTVLMNKKTSRFQNICFGKKSKLEYDVTTKLSKLIGKRMRYYDYIEEVSSIKYGSSEILSKMKSANDVSVEYYSEGDFTTVTFNEFNDKGDFVTLKKIAFGKVAHLNDY